MKRLFILLSSLSVIPAALYAGPMVKLPQGATLILPKNISAEWTLPPSDKAPSTAGKAVYFGVDPKDGLVWLGLEHNAIYVPQKTALMRTKAPFSQFVWLGNGDQVVSDTSAIGRLLLPAVKKPGLPVLDFKPVYSLSTYKNWTIAPAGKENLYITGVLAKTKHYQILLFGPAAKNGKLPFKVLYDTDASILATAGDVKDTYFSVGKAIFGYLRKDKKTQVVFVHPEKNVEQLEYAPKAGLFYATADGVGFTDGKQAFEFLRSPGCQIRLAGGSLYVLLGNLQNGVLRIKDVNKFKGAKFPRKEKTK